MLVPRRLARSTYVSSFLPGFYPGFYGRLSYSTTDAIMPLDNAAIDEIEQNSFSLFEDQFGSQLSFC